MLAATTAMAVAVAGAPASADDGSVIATGRRVGDVCVFDTGVQIPANTLATATETCDLVGSAYTNDDTNLQPAATFKPKTRSLTSTSPSSGGIQLEDNTGLLAQTDYMVYEMLGTWEFFNERGQLMYQDRMSLRFRVSNRDGYFSNPVPEGYCATGAAVFPYRPAIGDCTWSPDGWDRARLGVESRGNYSTYVGGLARYDTRDTSITMRMTRGSRFEFQFYGLCSPVHDMPVGWSTPGCHTILNRVA